MTQQYIRGEFSLHLGELCDEHPPAGSLVVLRDVRHRVETAPPCDLPLLAAEAMDAADVACWACLASGDVAAFVRESALEAWLYEFATSAGLLP